MKLGGIHAQRQATNFLLDKVGEPFTTRYINVLAKSPNKKSAKFAVIPDLHAINFPRRKQRMNDGGAAMSAEAVFEVKTYSANVPSYSIGDHAITPASRRAITILKEYKSKLKKLDKKFAPKVVGDGTEELT